MQFLWDTLDIIETVNTDDELDTGETLLKLGNTRFYRFFFQVLSITSV